MPREILQRGFAFHQAGDLENAAELYSQSLALCRSAEGHTLMGAVYHAQGRFDEAIAECKKAIEIDENFGMAFHDIGMYMVLKGKWDESVEWFQRAIDSTHYDTPQFGWSNVGMVYMVRGLYKSARECFDRALAIDPNHQVSKERLERVRRLEQ
jgi:Tfp pilus assembly protein PilF